MTERIVAAAVFHEVTASLPPPARHHTILQSMSELMGIPAGSLAASTQGFLTSEGRFVNRREAWDIAWRAKQIGEKTTSAPLLYSEDMW